jgi:hypothetical protein
VQAYAKQPKSPASQTSKQLTFWDPFDVCALRTRPSAAAIARIASVSQPLVKQNAEQQRFSVAENPHASAPAL